MKMKKWKISLIVFFCAVLIGGWFAFKYIKKHPMYIRLITDPIGPNRPVTWEEGPAEPSESADEKPPNIVVIMVDDLGYNDITYTGQGVGDGVVKTPNIDSIADNGVCFTNGYSSCATCAPSRASLLTGRFPTRFGFEFTPAPMVMWRLLEDLFNQKGPAYPEAKYYKKREKDIPGYDEMSLPAEEVTLPELLKKQDYHSTMVGKWHLGGEPGMRPTDHGFDEFVGFYPGASLFLPIDDPRVVNSRQKFDPIDVFLWNNLQWYVEQDKGGRFRPDKYLTDYFSDQAVKIIEKNRNRPFLLYLAYNAPHTPLQAKRQDYEALSGIADHTERVYGAMIRAVDRGVGRVLNTLRKNGLENNTMIFFTSDNGGANYIGLPDINSPYRGWKATFFEGGIHVPFFAKWPAGLPAGMKFEHPVAQVDIFATAAAAAGANLPSERTIDGVNLKSYLAGKLRVPPHKSLFWRSGHYQTLIAGDWKLQVSERPNKKWLFNMAKDPTEQVNLAASRPGKLKELIGILKETNSQMAEPIWPPLMELPVMIDLTLEEKPSPDAEYVYWAN